jgi:copper oxidase (laccase) domain-containing protein
VGPEVRRIALGRYDDAESWFRPHRDRFVLDLWSANQGQLLAAGVELANVETAGLCTICDRRFWSHRRDGSEAGRFALFLAIR